MPQVSLDRLLANSPHIAPALAFGAPAALGAISGFLGGSAAKKRRRAIQQGFSAQSINAFGAGVNPELQALRQGGAQDILAGQRDQVNRNFQGTQNAFTQQLARSGLLGGGFQAGGNAAQQLGRGGALRQADLNVNQFLQQLIQSQNQQSIGRTASMFGLTNQGSQQTPLLGALGGLGQGLQIGQGLGGGGGGGLGGLFGGGQGTSGLGQATGGFFAGG